MGKVTSKLGCSKSDHLRADPPFSWVTEDGKLFGSFSREKKIDA